MIDRHGFSYGDAPVHPERVQMRHEQFKRAGSRMAWCQERSKRRREARREALHERSYAVLSGHVFPADRRAFVELMLGRSVADVAALTKLSVDRVQIIRRQIDAAMLRKEDPQ